MSSFLLRCFSSRLCSAGTTADTGGQRSPGPTGEALQPADATASPNGGNPSGVSSAQMEGSGCTSRRRRTSMSKVCCIPMENPSNRPDGQPPNNDSAQGKNRKL